MDGTPEGVPYDPAPPDCRISDEMILLRRMRARRALAVRRSEVILTPVPQTVEKVAMMQSPFRRERVRP